MSNVNTRPVNLNSVLDGNYDRYNRPHYASLILRHDGQRGDDRIVFSPPITRYEPRIHSRGRYYGRLTSPSPLRFIQYRRTHRTFINYGTTPQ